MDRQRKVGAAGIDCQHNTLQGHRHVQCDSTLCHQAPSLVFNRPRNFQLPENSACCVVLPHAVREGVVRAMTPVSVATGNVGRIVSTIESHGFRVSAILVPACMATSAALRLDNQRRCVKCRKQRRLSFCRYIQKCLISKFISSIQFFIGLYLGQD